MKSRIVSLLDALVDLVCPHALWNQLAALVQRKKSRALLSRCRRHGYNVVQHSAVTVHNAEMLEIGDNVAFGDRVTILAWGGVRIGSRVMIAHDTSIVTATHNHRNEVMADEVLYQEVVIGDDVWIGAKCIILPGVVIGRGAVIGAGSIVTSSIPENAIAYGAPARVAVENRFQHPLKDGYGSFKYRFAR